MTDITVQTEQGTLRGATDTNRKGGQFYSFLGIRYARPPVGKLRFKDPQPPEPWTGIKDAITEGNQCYGSNFKVDDKEGLTTAEGGSDDCLFLNVFTPNFQDKKSSRPVMVFIHGGAFTQGSSSTFIYGPGCLLCEDVVLVTINYRIGALGFLAVDDSSLGVSGNAGLKDMVQALRWVKANIGQFGGNPDNVTIFGESAGSAAVHYLVLSPLAKGLFHKAILQSGVATNTWAQGDRNCYKDLARVLRCSDSEDDKILEFLQALPVEKVFEGQKYIGDIFTPSILRPFGPIIEKPSPNAFISDTPENIIKSGQYNQVPMIMGYTAMEGLLTVLFETMKMPCKIVEENTMLPFFYPVKQGTDKYREAENRIRDFYFGDDEPVYGTEAYIKLAGDNLFSREIVFMAKAHMAIQKPPVYFYIFSAVTSINFTKSLMKTEFDGASHGDDLGYLFTSALKTITPGSVEDDVIDKVVKLWTNFASKGDPIDETQEALKSTVWKPATLDAFSYLDIGTEQLKSGLSPDKERMEFWEEIFALAK